MSFFKELGKIGSTIGKTTGKVLKTVSPIANLVPGVGGIVSTATGVLGNILSPEKSAEVVNAVQRDQEIKVDKLETTIANEVPTATTLEVSQLAVSAAKELTTVVPTATVNDTNSVANVDFMTKVIAWIKSHLLIVAGVIIAFVFLFTKNGGRSKRRW